jgi:hypothetical protein
VGGEAELVEQLAYFVVVVAAVEAEPLRSPPGRLAPADRDRLDRGAAELEVVSVRAPGGAIPIGMPPPSVRRLRFA